MIKDIKQPNKQRNNDESLLNDLVHFEGTNTNKIVGTRGNIQNELEKELGGSFYNLISAPMLLARLVAAGFKPDVLGQEGYKCTWQFVLEHAPTGCILTFYDYKGGSSFGACEKGHKNEVFKKDVIKFLKAITNPRFPHPYDGCVVGEIA